MDFLNETKKMMHVLKLFSESIRGLIVCTLFYAIYIIVHLATH